KTTDPTKSTVPHPNQLVTIEIGRETWAKRESVFITSQTLTATTGADGTVHVPIHVANANSMAIRATSKDHKGNKIVDQTYVYVEGSPAQFEEAKGKIDITLNKRKYLPGDVATALIQTDKPGGSALLTTESRGIITRQIVPMTSQSTMIKLPVKAEFSPNIFVSVVYVKDKKFMESSGRIAVERKDRDLNIEVKADKEVYKPGDTAIVSLKTTDSNGKAVGADVSVGVVDEGIYDIAPDDTDLMREFYPSRSNDVETSFSFPEIYLDGGDKGSSKIPLRKTFRDTAQWNPSVWTGANGEAKVRVKLPDNLTEWRVTAVGITDKTSVGMETENFRAKKDLMVRLQLPQYLVSGDHQRMTLVIANDSGKDQDVHVETGVTGGATVTKAAPKTVHVPNGKPQTIECEVTAGEPGSGTVTARAWIDGGPTDGVQQSFPIEPHGRPVIVSSAGQGSTTFDLAMRPGADPKYGDLTINLSPTLVGDMLSSLDGLIGYPYGCVEQTMSRFMPSVLVDKTVRDLGLPRPKKLDDLPKIVRDSLTRLENMRHRDGGFGWWDYDTSDPYMTALVLDGLDRAKQAGVDVSAISLNQTLDWGMKWLDKN
ncbi:MAG: alpha-2-macroglobulin family protein, partial [Armatimonadota bacterium]